MEIKKLKIRSEYIKLSTLLKYAGCLQTGGQAKLMIQNGNVQVNGKKCTMRGKKIKNGDTVQIGKSILEVSTN